MCAEFHSLCAAREHGEQIKPDATRKPFFGRGGLLKNRARAVRLSDIAASAKSDLAMLIIPKAARARCALFDAAARISATRHR
jgi:hypothetical protein